MCLCVRNLSRTYYWGKTITHGVEPVVAATSANQFFFKNSLNFCKNEAQLFHSFVANTPPKIWGYGSGDTEVPLRSERGVVDSSFRKGNFGGIIQFSIHC
ncbi:hypothetical protein POVWA2_036070 [Plasmodium ovale wallikeri]|uniref:Uncharacterized protein n=1 Tax=Plasmodium ovale wallikeri TaxID=864142 RepID=A0A1A8Z401_PLAOA|nr:hypothetical protein POVWA1_036770 [Plasmodium ovale wallikeri]SBT38596.1 hypothetical protein POVWA2_036070 [Plasmodium ovale wallikeri]